MKIRINNIIQNIEHSRQDVFKKAAKMCGISKGSIISQNIARRSVDARKAVPRFNYSVVFEIPDKTRLKPGSYSEEKEVKLEFASPLPFRPVIAGTGPAGLFAGYYLAKSGCRPILLERGSEMKKRIEKTSEFAKSGTLDTECNIQFGEGGAGTFSDGKLTTRIGDPLCAEILKIFHKFGAPDDILYLAKPHVGTDILREVIVNIREEIKHLGGEFYFDSKLEDIKISDGKLVQITVNGHTFDCPCLILATGHSARDTYSMLFKKGIAMTPKSFAMGVRIEHTREYIDKTQYGDYAGHKMLGAADYRLAYNGERKCFSFCMCPGGVVTPAASEEGGVVVNGMSNHARCDINSNSALVVNVTPNDFDGVLGGIELQRECEQLAFMKENAYAAPVQLTRDFLADTVSTKFGSVLPSYPIGTYFKRMDEVLPEFVCNGLREGINYFDRSMKGFSENSILTGVETRTSAPIRIVRGDDGSSENVKGLYPTGEGAGYAGGIMSSAADGLKIAMKICKMI